ncbi:hypothetical protein FACS189411_14630 [Bacteroidia bacterium]|nr:hypothetical protein FACS189411_14630 [Bacteroidia bacterium]
MKGTKDILKESGKYVRELSIVVIGIAISFSINNWISDKSEKKDMKLYLGAIEVELERNVEKLELLKDHFERAQEYSQFLNTHEKALLEVGVTPYFVKTDGISGCCTVMISPDGERTMATFLGPAPTLKPDDITEETLAQYNCIYIEGYMIVNEPLVRSTMEKARRLGVKVALDLSNFNIVNAFKDVLDDLITNYVNILLSNEGEAKAFTGLEAREANLELAKRVDISIVTLGKEGALVSARGETVHVDAYGGKPLDTTGAGDNFAAGFLYGQSIGATLQQSARIGSLLAGHVVAVIGPQIPAGEWEQIKLKVKEILA